MRVGDEFGDYKLVRQIGRGAYGIVWVADRKKPLFTQQVAIKFPIDPNFDISLVTEEISLWSQVNGHPNIVSFIDAELFGNELAIVSEYIPDGSLEEWLKKNGGRAPSIDTAINIVCGILSGLKHLHLQPKPIIHRDLKPANILLKGENPCLADFGLARVLPSSSQSVNVAGSPAYMAPEAFDGKRNELTDIWSTGIILYELLAGKRPFIASYRDEMEIAIKTTEPAPLPIEVPPELKEIVTKALVKDRTKRYQSAIDMLVALKFLASLGTDGSTSKNAVKNISIKASLTGKEAKTFCTLGWQDFYNGLYAEALDAFKKATNYDPNYADAYYGLGRAYNEFRDNQKAIDAYQKAVDLGCRNSNLYYFLASAYENINQLDSAIEMCKEAINLDPTDHHSYYLLGTIYEKCQDLLKAEEAYLKVLEFNADYSLAYVGLGKIYLRLGKAQQAIQQFEQAIKVDLGYKVAHLNLGNGYLETKEWKKAIGAYKTVIAIDPDYVVGHYKLGEAYSNAEMWKEALGAYKQSIRINPDLQAAYDGLSWVYFKLGIYSEAIEACKQAIRLNPNSAQSHYYLGSYYLLNKNRTQALEVYKILKTLDQKLASELFERIYK